jgi:hypothetical protein
MNEDRRAALESVRDGLHAIASANDAEDHGYLEDARRMRSGACAALRALLDANPFLAELLPALGPDLASGRILTHGWTSLLDAVERELGEGGEATRE